MNKNKKNMLIVLGVLALTGAGTGCTYLMMKNKKPKLNVNSLSNFK